MQTKHVIRSVYLHGKTIKKSKEVIITRVRIMLNSRGIGMDFNQKGLGMACELTMIMIFLAAFPSFISLLRLGVSLHILSVVSFILTCVCPAQTYLQSQTQVSEHLSDSLIGIPNVTCLKLNS